jgi:hypothetical protein
VPEASAISTCNNPIALKERLTESADMQLPTDISPEGATIIFHRCTKSLQALRLQSARQTVALVESPLEDAMAPSCTTAVFRDRDP